VIGQLHAPAALHPEKQAHVTHWIGGGYVDPRVSLDEVEKRKLLTLPGFELRPRVVQPAASRYTNYGLPAIYTERCKRHTFFKQKTRKF
jgi:hypothetical protein